MCICQHTSSSAFSWVCIIFLIACQKNGRNQHSWWNVSNIHSIKTLHGNSGIARFQSAEFHSSQPFIRLTQSDDQNDDGGGQVIHYSSVFHTFCVILSCVTIFFASVSLHFRKMSEIELEAVSLDPPSPQEVEQVGDNSTEEDPVIPRATLIGLSVAYLSVFIDILGVSIILPIIPFLAIEFDASAQQIGFIYAGYAGAQMISVPISGVLSDRFGRRPLMMMSLFGSFVGFLFQGLAWNILSFILARVVAGLFGGSIPICQSYIADVIPVQQRGRYFAILGSVIVVAFLFGPGIGAGLAEFTLQTPMFVSSSIAAFGLILAFFFFKEPRHLQKEEKEGEEETEEGVGEGNPDSENETDSILTDSVDKYASKKYQWLVRGLWVVSFFNMLGFSAIIYFFGLFVFDQFGWGTLEVGFSTMLMGIFQVTIQILLFPKLQNRLGKHGCGILGSTLSSIGLLLFGFVKGDSKEVNGLPLLVLAVAFASFGNAMSVPSLSSVLSRYTSQAKQGATLGVAQSAEALARTVGPLLWGSIYESSRHLPFQISAAFYVVAGVLFGIILYSNQTLPEHKKLVDADEDEKIAEIDDDEKQKKAFKSLGLEEQVQSLLDENRLLKERLNRYEDTFETSGEAIALSDVVEIQRF